MVSGSESYNKDTTILIAIVGIRIMLIYISRTEVCLYRMKSLVGYNLKANSLNFEKKYYKLMNLNNVTLIDVKLCMINIIHSY